MTRDAGRSRNAHAVDSHARYLVELPASAAKSIIRRARIRADGSTAYLATVPSSSARLRGKPAVATDVDAVFIGWNTPEQKAIKRASPEHMRAFDFPAGSMGPKVEAACQFAELTGKRAAIGALKDLGAMVEGVGGTTVTADQGEIEWY